MQNTAVTRVEKTAGVSYRRFFDGRGHGTLSVCSRGQMYECCGNYGISADDEFITFASCRLIYACDVASKTAGVLTNTDRVVPCESYQMFGH